MTMQSKEWKQYESKMKSWLKELLVWQKSNPDKNWSVVLFGASAMDDSGGSNPPLPPPPPPPNNP